MISIRTQMILGITVVQYFDVVTRKIVRPG